MPDVRAKLLLGSASSRHRGASDKTRRFMKDQLALTQKLIDAGRVLYPQRFRPAGARSIVRALADRDQKGPSR